MDRGDHSNPARELEWRERRARIYPLCVFTTTRLRRSPALMWQPLHGLSATTSSSRETPSGLARRDAQAMTAGRRPAHKGRHSAKGSPITRPKRRPQVLDQTSKSSYANPTQMRVEYDLVMQWLAVPDLRQSERRILENERETLS